MEMSGLTQEWCSEMPEGESGSWLEGISELTKSGEVQAVRYHYIKGRVQGRYCAQTMYCVTMVTSK